MTTLVLIAWDLERAEASQFGDLFEKVQPDEVKIIYGSGSVDDAKLAEGIGKANVSFHHHKPVTEDPLFTNGKIDGDVYWGKYISRLAVELGLDVRRHVNNEDLHVLVGTGSTYMSGCLHALGDVLGARIWTLIGSEDERKAVDTSMSMPFKEMEAGVLSRMAEERLSGYEWVDVSAISAGSIRVPRPRGASSIANMLEKKGLLKKRQGGSKEYSLTDIGFLHAICELSRERLDPLDGSQEAVIMFHGGTGDAELESKEFRSYLDEHGLVGLFDKQALISVEWGDDDDKLKRMSKMLNDVIQGEDFIGSSSISNLLSSDEKEFHSNSSRLLTEIRNIASCEEEWSLIIEKIPAQLRSVVFRYCRSSGISVVSIFRRRKAAGATGKTPPTGLGKKAHRFRLPNENEISSIREGLHMKSPNARNVLATVLFSEDSGGNGNLLQKEIVDFNNTFLHSPNLRLEGKQNVTRGISGAEENGLISRGGGSKLVCSLTPSGEVLARMTLLQYNEE